MKDYKEFDKLTFDFGKDMKEFAQQYAGTMPSAIKTQLQDLMYLKFSKEIDAMTQQELLEVKHKKRFYDKLLKAKSILATKDRADAWFDKIFNKYFHRGILEHLIVYAILFLHKKDLFVPRRLFSQLDNNRLLIEMTSEACDYLGWTPSEAVEQPVSDDSDILDESSDIDDTSSEDNEVVQDEQENTDVVLYEPKEVQPIEQPSQAVMKVERTVTHEVVTASGSGQASIFDSEINDEIVENIEEEPPVKQHRFHRPGGKRNNNY